MSTGAIRVAGSNADVSLRFARRDSSIKLPDDTNTFGNKRWEDFDSLGSIYEALRLQCVLSKEVTACAPP